MGESRKNSVDEMLAESFKELVCHHPIEKITIKQITDQAGVIRPTFYNHFSDKYNLLEWILVQDVLLPIQPLVENGMINEAMRLIFYKIRREKEFYMHACRLEGQNSFRGMVEKGIRMVLCEMLEQQMQGKTPRNAWLTPEHISEYYAQSMTYIVISWIESGMELSPEELMEVYGFVITRSLADVLEDM